MTEADLISWGSQLEWIDGSRGATRSTLSQKEFDEQKVRVHCEKEKRKGEHRRTVKEDTNLTGNKNGREVESKQFTAFASRVCMHVSKPVVAVWKRHSFSHILYLLPIWSRLSMTLLVIVSEGRSLTDPSSDISQGSSGKWVWNWMRDNIHYNL